MKKSELRQLIRDRIYGKINKNDWKQFANNYLDNEIIDRMEGLANSNDLNLMTTKLRTLTREWMKEGFEKEDVINYLTWYINQQL